MCADRAKINKTKNNSNINNLWQLPLTCVIKISKCIGKHVTDLECFDINLVFLSVTNSRVPIASFVATIRAPRGPITVHCFIFYIM